MNHRSHLFGCLLVLAGFWVVNGCRRQPSAPTTRWSPSIDPQAALSVDTPEGAARDLLVFLRAHLQALAHWDDRTAARLRDRVVTDLLAADDLLERYRAVAGRAAFHDAEVLNRLVENWAATISYYADGLQLDRLRATIVSGDRTRAVVDVPAQGARDAAVIRVACRRDEDDRWRVLGLEFAPPPQPGAVTPATNPMR